MTPYPASRPAPAAGPPASRTEQLFDRFANFFGDALRDVLDPKLRGR